MQRSALGALVAFIILGAPAVQAEDVLLGRVKSEDILAIAPEWAANRDAYEPAETDLRSLAADSSRLTLDVYFGSWCGDSRREVPRLLKILDRGAPPGLRVKYYALDRTKKEPARLALRGAIVRVPTFILKRRGEEIGRIVETPKTTLEHDLALLLESARARTP